VTSRSTGPRRTAPDSRRPIRGAPHRSPVVRSGIRPDGFPNPLHIIRWSSSPETPETSRSSPCPASAGDVHLPQSRRDGKLPLRTFQARDGHAAFPRRSPRETLRPHRRVARPCPSAFRPEDRFRKPFRGAEGQSMPPARRCPAGPAADGSPQGTVKPRHAPERTLRHEGLSEVCEKGRSPCSPGPPACPSPPFSRKGVPDLRRARRRTPGPEPGSRTEYPEETQR
jgi:hypothetical protein